MVSYFPVAVLATFAVSADRLRKSSGRKTLRPGRARTIFFPGRVQGVAFKGRPDVENARQPA
jgi:hypothetical protein